MSRQTLVDLIVPGIVAAAISTVVIRMTVRLTESLPDQSQLSLTLRWGMYIVAGVLLTLWFGRNGQRLRQPVIRIAVLVVGATVLLVCGHPTLLFRFLPRSPFVPPLSVAVTIWTTLLSCFVCWMRRVPIRLKRLLVSVAVSSIAFQFVFPATYFVEVTFGWHFTSLCSAWSIVAAPQMWYMLQPSAEPKQP